MEIEQIVALLVAERDRLNLAIEALHGSVKRPVAAPAAAPARRKRSSMSAKARKEHSERMKAFWAARRKQKS